MPARSCACYTYVSLFLLCFLCVINLYICAHDGTWWGIQRLVIIFYSFNDWEPYLLSYTILLLYIHKKKYYDIPLSNARTLRVFVNNLCLNL